MFVFIMFPRAPLKTPTTYPSNRTSITSKVPHINHDILLTVFCNVEINRVILENHVKENSNRNH